MGDVKIPIILLLYLFLFKGVALAKRLIDENKIITALKMNSGYIMNFNTI
jgi:hypothetical protein